MGSRLDAEEHRLVGVKMIPVVDFGDDLGAGVEAAPADHGANTVSEGQEVAVVIGLDT